MTTTSTALFLAAIVAAQAEGGGLDLGAVDTGPVVEATSTGDVVSLVLALVAAAMLLSAIGFAAWSGRSATRSPLLSLASAPMPARLAITGVLGVYALTHAAAGASVYLNTRELYQTAAEYFFYLKPARMMSLSHAHLMGIATMDAVTAGLYVLSHRDGALARAVVVAAFGGIVGDIASWWLLKYVGSGFEILSAVTGTTFSVAFLVMATSILWATWRRGTA